MCRLIGILDTAIVVDDEDGNTVINYGKAHGSSAEAASADADNTSRSGWGDKYPPSIGLYIQSSDHDIFKFNVNMMECGEDVLKKKSFAGMLVKLTGITLAL